MKCTFTRLEQWVGISGYNRAEERVQPIRARQFYNTIPGLSDKYRV